MEPGGGRQHQAVPSRRPLKTSCPGLKEHKPELVALLRRRGCWIPLTSRAARSAAPTAYTGRGTLGCTSVNGAVCRESRSAPHGLHRS